MLFVWHYPHTVKLLAQTALLAIILNATQLFRVIMAISVLAINLLNIYDLPLRDGRDRKQK